MTELVQARVNSKIKRQAAKIFDSLGLDMSTGIKIYLATVVREQGVPFNLTKSNNLTPEQEKKLIAESNLTMRDYRAGRIKAVKNSQKLQEYLLA